MSIYIKILAFYKARYIDVFRWVGRVKIYWATRNARALLIKKGPLRILVDSSVLGHGITHETAWIDTGIQKWGPHDVKTGYAARIPVHSSDNDSRVYKQVCYLPGIAMLARQGLIELLTSSELQSERFSHPSGRYLGYGYFDYNIFGGIDIKSVDGINIDIKDAKNAQYKRINGRQNKLFRSILNLLGEKNSLDAWHIYTAERYDLYCLLHIDFSLLEGVKQNKKKEPFLSLNTKIMTPSEFGEKLGILPVHTNVLSYEGSSFIVHPELSWPEQRKMKPKKTPKQKK